MDKNKLIFKNVDDILEFAYQKEKEAAEFYLNWKNQVKNDAVKQVLYEFMQEEKKHMQLIAELKAGKKLTVSTEGVNDLKLGDYFITIAPNAQMDFQHALQVAIQRELGSVKLYEKLASEVDNPEAKELFSALKEEEQKHKLRLETIYDDEYLREN